MNDVSRDHRYLQSLSASRSTLLPGDEGMKGDREAGMCSLFVHGYVPVYCIYTYIPVSRRERRAGIGTRTRRFAPLGLSIPRQGNCFQWDNGRDIFA